VNECGLHKTKRTQVSASVAFVFDMPVIWSTAATDTTVLH
jgi:hypothetical protein